MQHRPYDLAYMVAGGRNHQNLRVQKGQFAVAVYLRDIVSQFEMVMGVRHCLNLLFRAAV